MPWKCARSFPRTDQEPVIQRDPDPALARVFREEWGRVLASLVGYLRDFDLAEDVVQDAFATAAERWPRDGVPDNPAGWLVRTARNEAIDRLRRRQALEAKLPLLDRPSRWRPWTTSWNGS